MVLVVRYIFHESDKQLQVFLDECYYKLAASLANKFANWWCINIRIW